MILLASLVSIFIWHCLRVWYPARNNNRASESEKEMYIRSLCVFRLRFFFLSSSLILVLVLSCDDDNHFLLLLLLLLRMKCKRIFQDICAARTTLWQTYTYTHLTLCETLFAVKFCGIVAVLLDFVPMCTGNHTHAYRLWYFFAQESPRFGICEREYALKSQIFFISHFFCSN